MPEKRLPSKAEEPTEQKDDFVTFSVSLKLRFHS